MNKFLPKLKKHLDRNGVDTGIYTLKWFFQCFLDRVRTLCKLWVIVSKCVMWLAIKGRAFTRLCRRWVGLVRWECCCNFSLSLSLIILCSATALDRSFKHDICVLLGYYAACNGNSVPTFGDNQSVPSWRVKKSKKKHQYRITTLRCVISQKITYIIYIAAEDWINLNVFIAGRRIWYGV